MVLIRGTVAIAAWAVLVIAGFGAVIWLLGGEVVSAVVAALIAWGAYRLILAVNDE
jgi:hypothetical protein